VAESLEAVCLRSPLMADRKIGQGVVVRELAFVGETDEAAEKAENRARFNEVEVETGGIDPAF